MMSQKQKELFTWYNKEYDSVIAQGSIRSGKSYAMSIAFIFWAMNNFNNCDFIMAGQSVGSLKRNVVLKLISILRRSKEIVFAISMKEAKNCFDVCYKDKKNRFYMFGGSDADSYEGVQGLTSAGAFFDESVLLNEFFVNTCIGRCSIEGSKYWFNCNPGSPMHWFKTEWVDKASELNIKVLQFNMDDNPSLSESKKAWYKRQFKGVFKRRYIDGEWAVAEGVIYENWSISEFDFHRMEQERDGYRRLKYKQIAGLDFGFTNSPTAFIMGLIDQKNMTVYLYNELYKKRLKTKQIYKEVSQRLSNKRRRIIGDSEAPGIIDELQDCGLNIVGAKKFPGSIVAGIQKIQAYSIVIHPTCTDTINEFNSYAWKNNKQTGKPMNEPLKENDHIMDALRYAMQNVEDNFKFDI